MRPVILEIYGRFLAEGSDVENREYAAPRQEIDANLIHRNYVSRKDVEVCLDFDLSSLNTNPNFAEIKALHQALVVAYGPEVEPSVVPEPVSARSGGA